MHPIDYSKVSIVIPTFNRVGYLEQCIESCLSQTYPCEIIVCDHGSTDGTPALMEKYTDRGVRYIRRAHDSGVHFCWLDGIISATHDLVHLNFDDDWIKPTFIEECLPYFNDEVGFVLSDGVIYREQTDSFSNNVYKLHKESGIYDVANVLEYNSKYLTSPCAGIYRKKILLDNLFTGKIPFSKIEYKGVGPDILFTLMSTIEYQKYGYVSKPLVVFRAHAGSITVDSQTDIEKKMHIDAAYEDARLYYHITRAVNKLRLRDFLIYRIKIKKYAKLKVLKKRLKAIFQKLK